MKEKFIHFLKQNGMYDSYIQMYDPKYHPKQYVTIDEFLDCVSTDEYIVWAFEWNSNEWVNLHEEWIAFLTTTNNQ